MFAALEMWLAASGATQSMTNLAWGVLSVVWLGHVAVSTRPGREPDLVGAFGRLVVAGGLLTGVGGLTRVIVLGFETMRDAGTAVLSGLIVNQNWQELIQRMLGPTVVRILSVSGAWFAYPWVLGVIAAGLVLGIALFAFGLAVYLAILFFAHLTLLLAIFLAPLAVALLAAPATQSWTVRWATVIVRTGLVVFGVRVVHAAAIYLAVIVPIRETSADLLGGTPGSGGPDGPAGVLLLLVRVTGWLLLMGVGTGIGVYAMLRVERLLGQFLDGVSLSEGIFATPFRLGMQAAAARGHRGGPYPPPSVVDAGDVGRGPVSASGAGSSPASGFAGRSSGGGVQEAAVLGLDRRSE